MSDLLWDSVVDDGVAADNLDADFDRVFVPVFGFIVVVVVFLALSTDLPLIRLERNLGDFSEGAGLPKDSTVAWAFPLSSVRFR